MMEHLWAFAISDSGQGFIQNIIAVVALVFAVYGVRIWRQERRDIRRAELAEKTLAVAYRAKDAIGMIRSPFGYGGEGSSRQRGPNESPEKANALDHAFTPIERLNKIADVFDEIQALRYSITAAFGRETSEPLLVFLKVRDEIIVAAQSNMREVQPEALGSAALRDQQAIDLSLKRKAVIWEGYGGQDEIVSRLDVTIDDLERTFRPYVEAKFRPLAGRLFRWCK